MLILVDTGVLLRLFEPSDSQYPTVKLAVGALQGKDYLLGPALSIPVCTCPRG